MLPTSEVKSNITTGAIINSRICFKIQQEQTWKWSKCEDQQICQKNTRNQRSICNGETDNIKKKRYTKEITKNQKRQIDFGVRAE